MVHAPDTWPLGGENRVWDLARALDELSILQGKDLFLMVGDQLICKFVVAENVDGHKDEDGKGHS